MVNRPFTKLMHGVAVLAHGVCTRLSGSVMTITRCDSHTFSRGSINMLTNLIRAGVAASALLTVSIAAQAADLPRSYKAPAYSAPSYASWSGFYLGINGGYGFGKASVANNVGTTGDFNVKGPVAGLTAGYNFQTGSWVWGLEGDIDYSNIKGTSSTFCVPDCSVTNTWLGTARARLGYAGWTNWMPYITGGAAFGGVKFEQATTTDTRTKLGWTAGVGLEYAILSNWSVKGEYLYADLGSAVCPAGTCNPGADVTSKFKTNLVRLGVNYRF
jgi:outer membrane immunogenic protein